MFWKEKVSFNICRFQTALIRLKVLLPIYFERTGIPTGVDLSTPNVLLSKSQDSKYFKIETELLRKQLEFRHIVAMSF